MSLIVRRLVRPEDAPLLVELLPRSPNSYGRVLTPTRHTIQLARLLREQAVRGVMVVDTAKALEPPFPGSSAHPDQVLAFAVTGFIDPSIEATLMRQPGCIVEALFEQEEHGTPCLLRPEGQAAANRGGGMSLVFLHFFSPVGGPQDPVFAKAISEMQDCFRLKHAGFFCRTALHPVDPALPEGIASLASMGFAPVREQLMRLDLSTLERAPFHPFICLLRREQARLGFSPGERQLLELALWQYDDGQIAEAMYISVETVKKRWRSIYQKVEALPEIGLFDTAADPTDTPRRGPEKRTKLLRYLDSHLCEIRP